MEHFWNFLLNLVTIIVKWGAILLVAKYLCDTALQLIK
jgi:hypothetical protein